MNEVTGSSLISGEKHDPERNELHLKFPNGAVYAYSNFGADKYEQFMAAESKGTWVAKNLRGNHDHPFRQVTPPQPKAK